MPKIVDKASRRIEIAKTAMPLFAEKGFEKTSIREITTQVGMGKGTFYDYFSDKEDILKEIVHIMFAEWTEVIVSKIQDIDNPIQQLSTLLNEGAKLGESFEQLMFLYIDIWRRSVSKKGSETFNTAFQSFLIESKQAIVDIIETAKQKNMIRKEIDADVIATILLALIDGLCLHHMILKSKIDMDYICQDFFKTLQKGIE